jgi:hypothetical protein
LTELEVNHRSPGRIRDFFYRDLKQREKFLPVSFNSCTPSLGVLKKQSIGGACPQLVRAAAQQRVSWNHSSVLSIHFCFIGNFGKLVLACRFSSNEEAAWWAWISIRKEGFLVLRLFPMLNQSGDLTMGEVRGEF